MEIDLQSVVSLTLSIYHRSRILGWRGVWSVVIEISRDLSPLVIVIARRKIASVNPAHISAVE